MSGKDFHLPVRMCFQAYVQGASSLVGAGRSPAWGRMPSAARRGPKGRSRSPRTTFESRKRDPPSGARRCPKPSFFPSHCPALRGYPTGFDEKSGCYVHPECS